MLAIVMVMLFELVILYFDNELYTDLRNGVFAKVKSEVSILPGSNFDILFMGDCYNQTGIDPRIFDHFTGLSSFNFSTDAYHTVMSSYVMLKNYLQANTKKPKYIFIGFLPMVWTQTKEGIIRDYLFSLSDYKNENIVLFLKEFGLMHTVKFFIPTLKHQDFLKKTTLSELLWRIRSKGSIDRQIVDYVFQYRGVFLPPEWGDAVKVNDLPSQCGGALLVSPFFKKYLEVMLELCRKNNIKVVYTVPAVPPSWAKQAEQCQYNKEIRDYLDKLKDKYKNLSVLNPQTVLNADDLYFNELHLNVRGVEKFSKYLAEIINRKEGRF